MSQTRPLINTLKQELRKRRITYKQVSEVLELSETSVKRLFSEEAFSIKRLEKVCELLHLDLSDLIHLMERNIELTLAVYSGAGAGTGFRCASIAGCSAADE